MLQLECANKKKEPPLFSCGTKYGAENCRKCISLCKLTIELKMFKPYQFMGENKNKRGKQ